MAGLAVFTVPQVERLAGISRRTIGRWIVSGVFVPEDDETPPLTGPFRRVFSFRDVVALRTLAKLRKQHGVSPDELARVGAYLRQHVDSPWSSLWFWVVNGHVVFRDPATGEHVAGSEPGQRLIEEIVIEAVARDVERESAGLQDRDPSMFGRVDRSRNVMSNQWVIAGTRIPTAVVWDYHEAGYTTEQIQTEYPDLSAGDVAAAIRHERALRKSVA